MKELIKAIAELGFGLIVFGIIFSVAMVGLQYVVKGIWAYSAEIVVFGFLAWVLFGSKNKSGK